MDLKGKTVFVTGLLEASVLLVRKHLLKRVPT